MTSRLISMVGFFILPSKFYIFSQAVSMVPNSSFEEKSDCPNYYTQFNLLYDWFKPVLGTSPDIYNSCWSGIPENNGSVPQNISGFQFAHTGQGYIGICLDLIYMQFISKNYREYISVRLKEKLKECVKYNIVFYVSLANRSNFKTEYVSGLFTEDKINLYLNDSIFLYQPQMNFKIIEADTMDWFQVEGVYLANGSEGYLTFGNFLDSASIQSIQIQNVEGNDFAYYYIDDVSLTELPNQELNIPNIITPNSDGLNDYFVIENLPAHHELRVYNRWGNQVYFSGNYQNDWSPPDLSTGVYFYILKPPCDDSYKGTVTVVREK